MNKILSLLLAALLLPASAAFAAVVEDWSGIASGNTGSFADSNGSKIDFAQEAGPDGGKALKLTTNMVQGGYCGIWHNITADLSKNGALQFKAKSSVPGDMQIALKDAFNVQYVSKVTISSKDWAVVQVPFSSFAKDPYYTPPDAIAGHPMDLSKTSGINFQPQMAGAAVVEIGAVEATGTASAAPAASSASTSSSTASTSSAAAPTGAGVLVLDFGSWDAKAGGTFQDSQGSTFVFNTKDNPNKKGQKYLTCTYELKQGGYCGMWCRTGGNDWKGVTLGGAKTLSLSIYDKDPISLGIAMQDKNNNQYVITLPTTKGSGKWETVTVNLADFTLDPYYTPPTAIKGAPKDFSSCSNFNFQPKTVGKGTFAVDSVIAR